MREAIDRADCPGAVVLVVHKGRVVWRKAYGLRAKQPAEVAMTADTVFDLASLTKPVATAMSVMLLVEQGKLRLSDHIADHIPAFAAKGKDKITVENFLLHTGGLIADNAESDYRDGRDKALERVHALTPSATPGERFVYSDVGFIVLGELVEKMSGTSLDAFARKNIFDPLGMSETSFRPGDKLKERAAPTAKRDNHWLVGEVHDPRSAALGGVAGHAGLFSTADDLAVFAQMLLDGGSYNGKRILKAETVKLMTTGASGPPRAARWLRLGCGHRLLGEPREGVHARCGLRPHRLHRHVALDRSAEPNRGNLPQQSPSSRKQGKCQPPARGHRHAGRGGVGAVIFSNRAVSPYTSFPALRRC